MKYLVDFLFPRLLSFVYLDKSFEFCILVDDLPFVEKGGVCGQLETVLIVGEEAFNNDLVGFVVLEKVSVDSC